MARANRLTTDGGVFHEFPFLKRSDHRFCPAETPRLLKRTRTFGFYRRAQCLTGKKRAKKAALRPHIEMIFCLSVCNESTCSGDNNLGLSSPNVSSWGTIVKSFVECAVSPEKTFLACRLCPHSRELQNVFHCCALVTELTEQCLAY